MEACQSSIRANNPIPDIGREKALRVRVANFQRAPIVSWKLRDSDFDETWSAGRPGPNSS